MKSTTPNRSAALLLGASALLAGMPAHAGWLDGLFGKDRPAQAKAAPGQRVWRIREFTTVEIVPRESGAPENQPPQALQPEALRQQLASVLIKGRGGNTPTLFAPDELAELIDPLVQALGRAGPGDDVLLLSASRREGGILAAPTAVTARLFVQGDSLQFIVHDARHDFYDAYRGTNIAPRFSFGSRTAAGDAVIQSALATNRRADWLSMPLRGAAPVAAPAPMLAPSASPAVAPALVAPSVAAPAPVVAPAMVPTPVSPPPAAAAARKPADAGGADELERRLETLKRLRDKNLITEDEYQQKRKEILQLL